jgi:hypothetical protein
LIPPRILAEPSGVMSVEAQPTFSGKRSRSAAMEKPHAERKIHPARKRGREEVIRPFRFQAEKCFMIVASVIIRNSLPAILD